MPNIPVVENPRKRRRRRRYTAKQRAYGFGGGRRRRTTRRRRRNPTLAALTNPRRRRRTYYVSHTVRRRRRNPKGLGGMFKRFDLPTAGWTAAGMVGTRALPNLVQKFAPMLPTMGPVGYLTKAATVALMGWAAGQFLGQRQSQAMVNGGLALMALDLFDQYVAPNIGMGMGGFVSTDELYKVTGGGVGGFVPSPPVVNGLGAYGPGSDPTLLSA